MGSTKLSFVATECGGKTDSGTILCGASNSKLDGEEWHSLIFARGDKQNDPDDDGIYFELDDQSMGGTNLVSKVRIDSQTLSIKLRRKKEPIVPHSSINVSLNRCSSKDVNLLKRSLKRIFYDAPKQIEFGD